MARIQRYEEQVRNVLYALYQYYLYVSFCVDLSSFVSVFEQVFDILKATIIKNFKDEQLLQGSDLMKTLIPDCPSVAKMILDTVRNRSGHETFQEKTPEIPYNDFITQNSKNICIISKSTAAHNGYHL